MPHYGSGKVAYQILNLYLDILDDIASKYNTSKDFKMGEFP